MGRVGTGVLPLQNPGFPEKETALRLCLVMPDARCPMPDARCPMPDSQLELESLTNPKVNLIAATVIDTVIDADRT